MWDGNDNGGAAGGYSTYTPEPQEPALLGFIPDKMNFLHFVEFHIP